MAEISLTVINSFLNLICYESNSLYSCLGLNFFFLEERDERLNSL